jgi:xanthine dehydrogenase small subunit
MTSKPIHFIRRGERVALPDVAPTRTLLQVLREDLHCTAAKEGCNEGDCGACTVVLGERDGDRVKYSAVNSCIRLAHSVDGMALWTAEDIATPDGSLHPAQQAMVQCFGSQCGFCTPGFVMSLFATYQNRVTKGETVTRDIALHDLSGNLCRCTGYRPILDAAQQMAELPSVPIDETGLLQQLELTTHIPRGLEADLATNSGYLAPRSLVGLLQARAQYPKAQIVAGCTDVGLWINKLHLDFEQVLDVTRTAELRRIEDHPHHLAIGAAATLHDAFAALQQDRPQLRPFFDRFAGLPVRNSGTLGGNIANGSPIGDSMPLLIALRANIVLMRWQDDQVRHRELRLEDFYTGYRKNVLQSDELLAWIKVPKPLKGERLAAYKISKRFEDDISAVCLVLNLQIDSGVVTQVSIGVGGVAATPVRAIKTEAALWGKPWTAATVAAAKAVLRAEFSPISDMRASAAYRTEVLGNLLTRYWLESQGVKAINLEGLGLAALDALGADRVTA